MNKVVNTEILYRKIWGERSLVVGELIAFLLGMAIIWFNWFGKWSFWIGAIVIFVGLMFF